MNDNNENGSTEPDVPLTTPVVNESTVSQANTPPSVPEPTSVQPTSIQSVIAQPTTDPAPPQPEEPTRASMPNVTKPKKRLLSLKVTLMILGLIILLCSATMGAYILGRGDKEVIFKEREPKSLDLPPQAVVMTECVPGRGKQYILPQDIPKGPIYDVHNGKVVAIEYRIVIKDVESDPNQLSNTILGLTRDYPVDHFSMVPEIVSTDKPVEIFNLIMFVVPKEEANMISCTKS